MRTMFPENTFLKKLKSGKAPVGFFNYFKDKSVMDIAGQTGIDFVVIDTEHAVLDKETVETQIAAAELNGLIPMVRVPDIIPYLMRNYMEMGARGLLVPHICCAADVKRAHDAFRYPPRGSAGACRSIHSTGYDPANWMKYLEWSKEVSLIAMIEDPEGVENIEEIISELDPELDLLMFGKADYGQAINALKPDGSMDQKVVDDYRKVVRISREHGIGFVACPSTRPEGQMPEDVRAVVEEGCSAIILNTDQYLLAEGLRRITNACGSMDIRTDF